MNSTPLITVLIDNYNYGRFIAQAIESALEQTYPNVEIIVVDDGSTDDSRDVIRRYAGRIRTIFKENGGQASAFNAGIAAASGEWICFLDSDDYWTKNKVQAVVDAITTAPEAGLVYDSVQPVDGRGTPQGKVIPHIYYQGDVSEKLYRTGGWWPAPPTSALTIQTQLLKRIGAIPETDFRLCADGFICYLVPLLSSVKGIRDICTRYRLHGGNGFSNPESIRGDKAFFDSAVLRYECVLSNVNRRLALLGSRKRLALVNHWPYRRALYHLRRDRCPSLVSLMLEALTWPGNRSVGLFKALWQSYKVRPLKLR